MAAHDPKEVDICLKTKHLFLITVWLLFALPFESGIQGTMIVQQKKNCGSLRYPIENTMQDRNQERVISHTPTSQRRGYAPHEECITSIIGKQGYQFQIRITLLEVDAYAKIDPVTKKPTKCNDYLKIYDSARADNARLLTPRIGLCGFSQDAITFTTCTSFVTFEFWTDWDSEDLRGFNVELEQFPWRIRGSTYTGESLTPGLTWSCFMKEFQDTWDKKSRVSSDAVARPSKSLGPYQRNLNTGVSCYSCPVCPVDYFQANQYKKEDHCYLCGKIHDTKRADAKRVCFSRSNYMALLRTFRDGSEKKGGYLGCQKYSNEYSAIIRYCFCNTDLCNGVAHTRGALISLFSFVVFTFSVHAWL